MNESIRFDLDLPPFGPFDDPTILVELAIRAEAAVWATAGRRSRDRSDFDPLELSMAVVDAGPPRG